MKKYYSNGDELFDSGSDDDEFSGLLRGGSPTRDRYNAHRPLLKSKSVCSLTALYFLVMTVNGALIGALGPSLEIIGRAVGVHDAVLARYVLLNRLCKFAGTMIWCAYSMRLQRPKGYARPHAIFAALMLISAGSAIALGCATRASTVQVALLTWGVAYGLSDSGVTSTQGAQPPSARHTTRAHALSLSLFFILPSVRSSHRLALGPRQPPSPYRRRSIKCGLHCWRAAWADISRRVVAVWWR